MRPNRRVLLMAAGADWVGRGVRECPGLVAAGGVRFLLPRVVTKVAVDVGDGFVGGHLGDRGRARARIREERPGAAAPGRLHISYREPRPGKSGGSTSALGWFTASSTGDEAGIRSSPSTSTRA